jgi:hypothetical protein
MCIKHFFTKLKNFIKKKFKKKNKIVPKPLKLLEKTLIDEYEPQFKPYKKRSSKN